MRNIRLIFLLFIAITIPVASLWALDEATPGKPPVRHGAHEPSKEPAAEVKASVKSISSAYKAADKETEKPSEKEAAADKEKPQTPQKEASTEAKATEPAKTSQKAVDVVLVLDSSGSMKVTDPLNLRVPAARLFVSLLGKDDRAAIIGFTTTAAVLLPLTPVKGGDNPQVLARAIEKITSTGPWTNIYDAMQSGLDLLTKGGRPNAKHIVVLMSDGKMDMNDTKKDAELVDELKNNLMKKYKEKGITVYTMAFSSESDTALLEYIAKATEGLFYVDLTSNNLHIRFATIFENLKTPEQLPMSNNTFLVDKSIEEVTIVANKGTPQTVISLVSPDKKEYHTPAQGEGIKWSVSDSFDMITLEKPIAGRWSLKFSTETGNKAYIITNLKLETDFNKSYLKMNERVNVGVWILKEEKRLEETEVLQRMTFNLELTHPDGHVEKLAIFDNGEDGDKKGHDGIYTGHFTPTESGRYLLKAGVGGSTFERTSTFTFEVNRPEEKMPLTEEKPKIAAKPIIKKSILDSNVNLSAIGLGNAVKGLTLRLIVASLVKVVLLLSVIISGYLIRGKAGMLFGKIAKRLKIKRR